METSLVGVDGCQHGWIAAEYNIQLRRFTFTIHADITSLLQSHSTVKRIAIDIPIGLTETFQPRRCDQIARRFIGPRRSSVFPAPDRRILKLPTYAEATDFARRHSGKGITQQSFAILRKIDAVDTAMSPNLQSRVFEVHPEVCFREAAGRNLNHSKRRSLGFEERRAILQQVFTGVNIPTRSEARACGAAPDDVLDAAIAAWTAMRHTQGCSNKVPVSAELDARGLRMEIVY